MFIIIYILETSDNKLETSDNKLETSDNKLETSGYKLETSGYEQLNNVPLHHYTMYAVLHIHEI